MHDPRLEDHAVGVELQLVELNEQAERARVQGRLEDARSIQAETDQLLAELADTADRVAEEPPLSPHIFAEHASD
jgi:hypothetical protein